MGITSAVNIPVTVSAGDVKPKMDEVNKALDSVSAKSLEQLRDKSEEALNRVDSSIASTVANLEKLKVGLANTGGVDNRLLKATEAQFERLKRLGLDADRSGKIAGTIEQVKAGAGLSDPKAQARDRELENDQRAKAVDAELQSRSDRVLETLRSREAAKARREEKTRAENALEISPATQAYEEGAGKRNKILGAVTKKALGAAGIEIPDKAAGELGVAGAVAAAAFAAGQASSSKKELQRSSGISGTAGGNLGLGIGGLPLVSSLRDAAGEVIGGDFSPTKRKADLENATEAAALYEKYRSRARDAAVEEAKATRDNATIIRGLANQQTALALGAKPGQMFAIQASTQEAINAAAAKRDDKKSVAESEIGKINRDFNAATTNLRNTASGRAGTAEGDAAKKELDRLAVAKSQAIKELRDRQAAADEQFKKESAGLTALGQRQEGIASGAQENTTAVLDSINELDKKTRDLSGDPFEAMRKSILELKPSAENLDDFNKSLERYEIRVKAAELEARRFGATKAIDQFLGDKSTAGQNAIGEALTNDLNNGVDLQKALRHQKRLQDDAGKNALASTEDHGSSIGLGSTDAAIKDLINAGIQDKTILARIRIQLEANDAKQVAADLKERLAAAGDAVRESLAQTPLERAQAEVAARDRQLRGPDRKGAGLSDEQKQKDIAAALDKDFAGRAGAMIEATKLPQEKFAESLDAIKEAARRGFLSDEQIRRGVGSALAEEADALRTPRPELMVAGTAATQQFLAVTSGAVLDSNRPEIQLAREANSILTDIRDSVRARSSSSIAP